MSTKNGAEREIEPLITAWASAVHHGDLAGVLRDHAEDIVMFDVPPPDNGVRGLSAYRDTWPPFFEFQRGGASFEIVELDVTAGDDVAFAFALLRCGTQAELDENPSHRLRLTLGLRRSDGRWQVTHEHHSFPDRTAGDPDRPRPLDRAHRFGGLSSRLVQQGDF